MKVKDAVSLAIQHIGDLFEHEKVTNLGLEEVEYDHDASEWEVTVGFSRPWDYPANSLTVMAGAKASRSYKIVKINDNNSQIISIKNRPVSE